MREPEPHFGRRMIAHFRRGLVAYTVLAVSVVSTLLAFGWLQSSVRTKDAVRFAQAVERVRGPIQDGLERYTAHLLTLRGLFEASRRVQQSEWERFIDSTASVRRDAGIRSVGYAAAVEPEHLRNFEANTRRQFGDAFSVINEAENKPTVHFPTLFLRQFVVTSDSRIGWDAMSDISRRLALEKLWRNSDPTVSRLIQFEKDREPVRGYVTYMPVRKDGTASNAIDGVVFSSFIPQKVVDVVAPLAGELGLKLEMKAGRGNEVGALVAHAGKGADDHRPSFLSTSTIHLFDQAFTLGLSSLPRFEQASDRHLPQAALGAGCGLSLLLFGITFAQSRARHEAETLNLRLRASEDQLRTANQQLERTVAEVNAAGKTLAYERDLLRTLLDHAPDGIYFKDRDSRFIKCGRAVVERLGVTAGAATGKTDFEFFTDEHARAAFEAEQRIVRTGQPMIGVVEKETWRDGKVSWVLTSKMPLRDKNGNIIGTFGISKDVTSLKKAELELEQEKELLAVTLRSIGDGVITTDVGGKIVLFNAVAERLTGWASAEAIGKPLNAVFCSVSGDDRDSDTELIRKAIGSGTVHAPEAGSLLTHRDGSQRTISQSVAPIVNREGGIIGAVLVFRDITEKLKTEEELAKANKLESIGVLAGGIAHDFNNILTVVLGNITLARMMNEGASKSMLDTLAEAEKASLRARDLTQRLLTFAKGGAPIKRTVQVGPMVREAAGAALLGSSVQYHLFISDDLWNVDADESQLVQVIQNLVNYSRHTMVEEPRIDLHVINQEIAKDPLLFLQPGRYVRISLRDYGAGVQPDHLHKIFDPYFAGKKLGNGLELATAYSIIRKHGGQIRVESISGQGTVFHIYLPASSTPQADAPVEPSRRVARAGQGRVLVMDDEPGIRKLAAVLLQRLGYTVETAADGAEAIELYEAARAHGKPFRVVIMDLTVPHGMGGQETIRQLRLLDPDVKAIVSSGYSNDPVMANYRSFGFCGVVPKPYDTQDLAVALDQLIGEEQSSASLPGPRV